MRSFNLSISWTVLGLLGVWSGCTPDQRPVPPKPVPPSVVLPCKVNAQKPGPMRRTARVDLQIHGPGVNVDVKGAPGVCGPMFNSTAPKMGITAGDGLLFEVCVPEGLLQISSFERKAGTQSLHGYADQAGVEVEFNNVGKGVFSSRGVAGDRVAFSDDFWKAEAQVKLHDVATDLELEGKVSFDCSTAASP